MSDISMEFTVSSLHRIIDRIKEETEWLSTTEGDEVACISVENLIGILNDELVVNIKLVEP